MTGGGDLKRRLRAGEPVFGCWLELFSPIAAEVVALAGYDCVLVDLEHGPGSTMDALAVLQAAAARDCAALVRVPANDPVAIKKALDIGVAGVMVPSVDSAAEATSAVSACRYPPRGRRGMAAGIVRASGYGTHLSDYLARAEQDLLIICQIESAAAVENAAAIAAVDGVDLLFVGPFDLSASCGHLGEPDHPEVQAMIGRVEAAARAAGTALGALPTPERPAAKLLAAGHRLLLADVDVALLGDAARANVASFRALAGKAE